MISLLILLSLLALLYMLVIEMLTLFLNFKIRVMVRPGSSMISWTCGLRLLLSMIAIHEPFMSSGSVMAYIRTSL